MNWLALIQRWLPIIVTLISSLLGGMAQQQATTVKQLAPALQPDSGVKVPEGALPNSALLAYVVAALSAITGGIVNKPSGGGSSVQDAAKGIAELLISLISQGQLDDYSAKKLAEMEAAKTSVLLDVAQHEIQRRQSPPATIPIRPTT
jgi:hypothetical protein